jgi:hypothetical protein
MSEMAVVGAFFLAAAAVIRSFPSIETQSLLAIRAGKMIWEMSRSLLNFAKRALP